MEHTQKIMGFLEQLSQNNDREWFNAHKSEYKSAFEAFKELVAEFIREIQHIDPSIGTVQVKECVFRIYRDVRFSKDKSPYKTHFGAYIAQGGRKSENGGYYLHIEPGASMAAGGMYRPAPNILKAIRQEIYFNLDEFNNIMQDPGFKKTFGSLMDDDKLTRPPKGYTDDFPGIEYLKHKNFAVWHKVDDRTVLSKNFIPYCLDAFTTLKPLNDFLNRAVEMMQDNES